MNTQTLIERFKAARRAGVPLLNITTPDQPVTVRMIGESYPTEKVPPMLWYDVSRGLQSANPDSSIAMGQAAVAALAGKNQGSPLADLLRRAPDHLPEKSVLFVSNYQLIADPLVVQATINLRDQFKKNFRTLVTLSPGMTLPPELAHDFISLEEPLPDIPSLEKIVDRCFDSAKIKKNGNAKLCVDACCGLSAFTAEQVVMMSINPATMDVDLATLHQQKRAMIENTPGLSVNVSAETFDSIGGCDNAKKFLSMYFATSKRRPRCIVWIDEGEKAFAGATQDTSDSSGVSQNFRGYLQTEMQEREYDGMIFLGPPGAAKSAMAKATGAQFKTPVIVFDLAGMKAGVVGDSERRLRHALQVVRAVSQGDALFIMTTNDISQLHGDLLRRFKSGTFFFDLPTLADRKMIWEIYEKKYELGKQKRPADSGWTGAEIRECCYKAWRLDCSLLDAAEYVVPVATSMAEDIHRLRSAASAKYINAGKPGVYVYKPSDAAISSGGGRTFSSEEV